MEITRGKIQKAKKVVIYGPEGIGKSTFAARFPGAVFIDTEGSTNDMDVARLPRPTSWNMLFDEIEYIKTHTDECRTLVIDSTKISTMYSAIRCYLQKGGIVLAWIALWY